MATSCEVQQTASSQTEVSDDKKTTEDEIELPKDFEPGASRVRVLLSTGSYEEENVANDNFENYHRKGSCISEIEQGVADVNISDSKTNEAEINEPDKSASDVMYCLFLIN